MGGESGPTGLAHLLHRVLSEHGDPALQAYRPPSGCAGRGGSTSGWNAATSVHMNGCEGSGNGHLSCSHIGCCATDALRTGRHEPDESRGSRPALWGREGEIPAPSPAGG